ncbi:hypothetical protein C8Q80DRAFT_587872 [Daedaleopsis nitida]|nr:hypothetical protein C8Q80DRAFT_587872 [Daedaleopsis nitida]
MDTPVIVTICIGGVTAMLWASWRYLAPVHLSPLTLLPGPPSPSLLYGNFKQISNVNNNSMILLYSVTLVQLRETYGGTQNNCSTDRQ